MVGGITALASLVSTIMTGGAGGVVGGAVGAAALANALAAVIKDPDFWESVSSAS